MTTRAELRRLAEAASPRPWRQTGTKAKPHWYVSSPDVLVHGPALVRLPDTPQSNIDRWNADAALIVAAVNSLPDLLDQLDRQEAEIGRLREALKIIADGTSYDPEGAIGVKARNLARAALAESTPSSEES